MIKIPEIPYIYPICILFAFIITFLIIFIKNKKENKENLFYSFLIIFIFSMAGGCFYSLIENLIINKSFVFGLSAYGGAIGLLIGCAFIRKLYSGSVQKLTRDIILSLPLMYGLSKTACLFAGCCHGIEYNGLLSVTYHDGGPYLPIQFIETLTFILIYIIIQLIDKKENKNVVAIMMILSGIAKGGLDFLRASHSGISSSQILSVIFILVGVILIVKHKGVSYEKDNLYDLDNNSRM